MGKAATTVGGSQGQRLAEPLLGQQKAPPPSLGPLFAVAFFTTLAHMVVQTPALCLQFQDLAQAQGFDSSSVVVYFGALLACRSLVELAATPRLTRWSDRVGRKAALCLVCAANCVEFALLASVRSLVPFCLVHVAGGILASHNAIEGSCIIDALPSAARGPAFMKLFVSLGLAFVFGPALSGELSSRSRAAPLVLGAVLSAGSFIFVAVRMPEYLAPEAGRRRRAAVEPAHRNSMHAFVRLVMKTPGLPWYVATCAVTSLGISTFVSVRTLWVRLLFGWDGREIGRVVAAYGITLIVAQFILLPLLLHFMRGHEVLLAQLCLLIHVARFLAYGLAGGASRAWWLYATLIASSAGNCSVPVVQALCSRCVDEDEQGLLSGGASALNTAMQAIGAVVGSQVFAISLRAPGDVYPSSTHLLVSAGCIAVAAACVAAPGLSHEAGAQAPRAAALSRSRSWVSHAEGMHGMDASLPAPTARGSMLLRGKSWIQHENGQTPSNEGVAPSRAGSQGSGRHSPSVALAAVARAHPPTKVSSST